MNGTVSVDIDEVDLEQAVIERPEMLKNASLTMRAMATACLLEPIVTFQKSIHRHGLALQFKFMEELPDKKCRVVFSIIRRSLEVVTPA